MTGVYAVLNAAAQKNDVDAGVRLIRTQIPPLLNQAEQSLPALQRAAENVKVRTQAGRELRTLMLTLARADVRMLVRFRDDLATSRYAWDAANRFGEQNNKLIKRLHARMQKIVKGLPAAESRALKRAVGEIYGPG